MNNPRINRLQADYKKVRKLVDESGGSLRLVRTTGAPPSQYVIEYRCPSLVKEKGQIFVRNEHQVEITIGVDYPFGKPSARMLTPVFNPHVFPIHAICLGTDWSPAETLDTLILRIGAILQLDPRVLNPKSPANGEANLWVQQNRSRIPLGTVSFKAGEESKPRVQWG